jgi:LysM repeat protein
MTDVRGPVRHGNRTRRPARPPEGQQELVTDGPSVDLEAISAALAERSAAASRGGTRPAAVLRFAGLPLLLAAMVASAQPAAAAESVTEQVRAPAGPHAPSEAWSVTAMASAPKTSQAAAAGTHRTAPAQPAAKHPVTAPEAKPTADANPVATPAKVATSAKKAAAAPPVKTPAAPVKTAAKQAAAAPVKTAATPAKQAAAAPVKTAAAPVKTAATPAKQAAAAPVKKAAAGPAEAPGKAPTKTTAKAPDKTVPARPQATAPATKSDPAAAQKPGEPDKPGASAKPGAPSQTSATAAPAGASTTAEPAPTPVRLSYTARPGDTLPHIAGRSGRSVASLIALNKLRPDGLVVPGQVILLPSLPSDVHQTPSSAPAPSTASPPAAAITPPPAHQPVAKAPAGSPVKAPAGSPVKEAVKTPPPKTPPAKAPAKASPVKAAHGSTATPVPTRPYLVVEGDTLTSIAKAHHTDVKTLLALNHLHLNSLIHPKQKLLLPAPPPPPVKTPHNTFLGRTYPPAVVAAADANRRALSRRKVPTHAQTQAMVASTAKAMGVDPALVQAIAYQESGFDQHQVSPANAVGVMQIIPSAGKWASTLVGHPLDLLDPKDNITAGVALLAALSSAAGNEPEAIAGYYQGLSSVQSKGMYDDTRRYVANVQTLKARFTADA